MTAPGAYVCWGASAGISMIRISVDTQINGPALCSSPFGAGSVISLTRTKDLPLAKGAITGLTIINAENLDAVVLIAQGYPNKPAWG